jgi:hypothetical protein
MHTYRNTYAVGRPNKVRLRVCNNNVLDPHRPKWEHNYNAQERIILYSFLPHWRVDILANLDGGFNEVNEASHTILRSVIGTVHNEHISPDYCLSLPWNKTKST